MATRTKRRELFLGVRTRWMCSRRDERVIAGQSWAGNHRAMTKPRIPCVKPLGATNLCSATGGALESSLFIATSAAKHTSHPPNHPPSQATPLDKMGRKNNKSAQQVPVAQPEQKPAPEKKPQSAGKQKKEQPKQEQKPQPAAKETGGKGKKGGKK
jgi:hypothetical protein